MGTLHIRPAQEPDQPAMVRLLKQLYDMETDFDFDEYKQTQGLQLLLQDSRAHLIVATSYDQVIGMVSIQWVYSTVEGGKSAWIEDVVVDHQHRGKKIGSQLLNAAKSWCLEQNISRMQLVYDLSNQAAIQFYHQQGWQPTHLGVKKYVLDNEV